MKTIHPEKPTASFTEWLQYIREELAKTRIKNMVNENKISPSNK